MTNTQKPLPKRTDERYLRGWYLVETGNYKQAREMAREHRRNLK